MEAPEMKSPIPPKVMGLFLALIMLSNQRCSDRNALL
jgi:hypothetical protein